MDCHLFVLVHGLWGNPNHMTTIETVLNDVLESTDSKVAILRPSSFRFWKTYDGVKICAERVLIEMFYEIETLKKNNLKVTEISFVGYSFGGLISRYLIGILEEIGFFHEVKPVFFTTFASPHVGVEFFKKNFFDYTANAIGGYLFGPTGRQLFINDRDKILVTMADPKSRYFKGLKRFEKLMLLANVKNDRSVSFFTSFITDYSPFEKFDVVKIKYLKDLPESSIGKVHVRGKFVDLRRSHYQLGGSNGGSLNVQEETSFLRTSKLFRVGLILLSVVILPIWIPTILTVTFLTSMYSMIKVRVLSYPSIEPHWQKVRTGVYGSQGVDDEDFKIGTKKRQQRKEIDRSESFKGDTSNLTEMGMESMLYADERIHGDGHVVGEEDVGDAKVEDETSSLVSTQNFHFDLDLHKSSVKKHLPSLTDTDYSQFPLFVKGAKLPVNKDKKAIIENLNSLGWIKIPIFLDAWNAHDGIVARRGVVSNPKGTASIALWASMLVEHMEGGSEAH
ncbi:lipid droplet phospholipase 1 [[Candida] jaroonii]|uniref:Lipid droplet phospholipase 1 n=1 Tax=[Candida] jaroonii TaxID=467808 RepID=A0ACA9YCZ5_9ASCO|nr:lipid droplet phospholipase 1 [[Candida] jaroonii]